MANLLPKPPTTITGAIELKALFLMNCHMPILAHACGTSSELCVMEVYSGRNIDELFRYGRTMVNLLQKGARTSTPAQQAPRGDTSLVVHPAHGVKVKLVEYPVLPHSLIRYVSPTDT